MTSRRFGSSGRNQAAHRNALRGNAAPPPAMAFRDADAAQPEQDRPCVVRVTDGNGVYQLKFAAVLHGTRWFNADGRGEKPLTVRVVQWRYRL